MDDTKLDEDVIKGTKLNDDDDDDDKKTALKYVNFENLLNLADASDVRKRGKRAIMEKILRKKIPFAILLIMLMLLGFASLRSLSDPWSSYPKPPRFLKSHDESDAIYTPTTTESNDDRLRPSSNLNVGDGSSLIDSRNVRGSMESDSNYHPPNQALSAAGTAASVLSSQLNASLTGSTAASGSKFWCGRRPCAERVSCGVTVNASYVFQEPNLIWSPRRNKYLMMVCGYGQFCSRLDCILHHLIVAAFLNRTLVFPMLHTDFDFENLLDIPRISQCLGRGTIVSLAQFHESRNGTTGASRNIQSMRMLASGHVSGVTAFQAWTKIEIGNFTNATAFKDGESSADFFRQFDVEDEVFSVGEGFGTIIGPEACLLLRGFQPFKTSCHGPVLLPHRNILKSAWGFVRTFLGYNFTSVHLRRGGRFFLYCTRKNNECYYSIPQVADCLRRHQQEINGCEGTSLVYVATNGRDTELEQLQSIVSEGGDRRCRLTLVTLSGVLGNMGPEGIPSQEWNSELTDVQRKDRHVVDAIDRTISALGRVFLGDRLSTFSAEIQRLRTGWGFNNDKDGYLCGGAKPDWRERPWMKEAKRS